MFFEEYGMHGIANLIILSGEPDPMPLIYMFFSLWGFAQVIFCGVSWIVIFRYRALIPLMYVFWLIEWSGFHNDDGYFSDYFDFFFLRPNLSLCLNLKTTIAPAINKIATAS